MQPLLYNELVPWYRLVDPPRDHQEDAQRFQALLEGAVKGEARTLLELGAGAGHNALFLKERFRCTLTDLSEGMRGLSQELNPQCEHLPGDMRTLRLGRTFDAVLVHDAVAYMTTREDLRAAAQTAFEHTRAGGAALFAPDCVRETFRERAEVEGDDAGERGVRFLMWTRDPNPDDDTYLVDFAFLLREGEAVRAVHDQHVEGVFARAVWVETLRAVGFEVACVAGAEEDGVPLELFVCRRP